MWVQVSGMIGANSRCFSSCAWGENANFVVYQSDDSPRYFKANKGLLVICIWMCVSALPPFHLIYALTQAYQARAIPEYIFLLSMEKQLEGKEMGCYDGRAARRVQENHE